MASPGPVRLRGPPTPRSRWARQHAGSNGNDSKRQGEMTRREVVETDSVRVASVLAEAEASRRGAEAHAAIAAAQTAESAESAAVAWEAADASDAARAQAEERALTAEERVGESGSTT
jgi:hypothetical protein